MPAPSHTSCHLPSDYSINESHFMDGHRFSVQKRRHWAILGKQEGCFSYGLCFELHLSFLEDLCKHWEKCFPLQIGPKWNKEFWWYLNLCFKWWFYSFWSWKISNVTKVERLWDWTFTYPSSSFNYWQQWASLFLLLFNFPSCTPQILSIKHRTLSFY